MRKGRPHAIHLNVAFWSLSAFVFFILAPPSVQAQQASEPKWDVGTIDANTLFIPAGVTKGTVARGHNPTTDSEDSATERGVWYSGYDAVRGAQYAFTGGTVALNGDLSRNGFFLRAYGSWVRYELDPGHGRGYQTDLMLGYRFNDEKGKIYGGIYIGADYQNYRLDPDDPTAQVRGTEWGFKVAADLATLREGTPLYYALVGNYSTSFQTYWARARVGVNLHGVTFGPEGIVLGDVGFDAQRVGAFLIFDLKPFPKMAPIEVGLSVGHQFVAGEGGGVVDGVGGVGGGEGTYGGIVLTLLF